MSSYNLDSKGRLYTSIDVNHRKQDFLFIRFPDEAFKSDNIEIYKDVDDNLFNSTCYLVLSRTLISATENKVVFNIINPQYYRNSEDSITCIGIIVSKVFFMEPYDDGTDDITAIEKFNIKPGFFNGKTANIRLPVSSTIQDYDENEEY